MKYYFFYLVFVLFQISAHAQTDWAVNGNNVNNDARIGTNNNFDVILETNNTERLRLTDDGKVGIGTNSPDSKLHLIGDFKLDGQFYIPSLTNTEGENLLYIDPSGALKKLSFSQLYDMVYHRDACAFDMSGNIPKPIWNASSSPNFGYLYTGQSCETRVGIGTSEPLSTLDVRGSFLAERCVLSSNFSNLADFANNLVGFDLESPNTDGMFLRISPQFDRVPFRIGPGVTVGNDVFRIRHEGGLDLNFKGDVGGLCMNITRELPDNPSPVSVACLTADGKWYCQGVIVKNVPFWPDYVFDPSYKLMSIQETDAYIKVNHHLPGMPSTEEIANGGADMYELIRVLTEKVEQLTLYTIEQQKEIESLKCRVKLNSNN